ncbi:PepSY domain-containing protein [Mycetohabitans rhizoxinica]|uniref:PepSY domain-containing protein n=1 Tax=Mycetohabitans rhizoxinica TaxID=412963 RepID=UPI0030CFC045
MLAASQRHNRCRIARGRWCGRYARITATGVPHGYESPCPARSAAVHTVPDFPDDPQHVRTVYLHPNSGAILRGIGYRNYGTVSQATSYGTTLHMGRDFGLVNQLLCTTLSIGLAAMVVTGAIMGCKHCPAGSIGTLRCPRHPMPMRSWTAALVLLSVVFPLIGMTLIAVWLADRLLFARLDEHGVPSK